MTPTAGSTAGRLTTVLAAAFLALTTGILPAAQALPTASSTPSTAPSPSVDARDADLQLPAHSRLARPKVLQLDQQQRGLTQVVTTNTASPPPRPQPFPAQQSPSRRPKPDRTGRGGTTTGAPTASNTPGSPRPSTATPPATTRPKPTTAPHQRPALRTALGLLALLAALLIATFTLRTRQHRRRTERGSTTTPTPASASETRSAATPDGLTRLDTALRTLAHHDAQGRGQDLPQLQAARISAGTLAVLPDDPTLEPATPFTTGTDGWWHLPDDAALLDEETARTVPAPYPALATIGTITSDTAEGGQDSLLLLNLAHCPALLLEADHDHAGEVLNALVMELITSPFAAHTRIITLGFGHDLPQLTARPHITFAPGADDAVREISEHLLEAAQLPHPERRPHLLLSTRPLDDDLAAHIADLAHKASPVPLILIAPAHSGTTTHFPQALRLNASPDKPQHLDHLDATLTVQRLPHSAYQQLIATLKGRESADQPHQPPVPEEGSRSSLQTVAPLAHQDSADAAAGAGTPARADTGHSTNETDDAFPALRAAARQPAPPSTAAAGPHAEHAATGHASPAGPTSPRHPNAPGTPNQSASARTEHSRQPTSPPAGEQEQAPQIRVLGPVEVTGVRPHGHGPRIAQLAALLYFKPGRTTDELCTHMDPTNPWTPSTLNARLHGLRRALGNDPNGRPHVPRRTGADTPYHLSPHVECDWAHFRALTHHAPHARPTSLEDLEEALSLIRGKPFGGKPLPWAEPLAQEMTTRIVDTAHAIATHRTPPGPHHNPTQARRAIATALDIDETSELLYRDWMKIEAAAGNRPGLHTAIARLQHVTRTLNVPLEAETEQLIEQLLHTTSSPQTTSR
ncbi:hypothetical protein ACFZAD_35185 [Streptomyces iakyrus]|uniref:hypothetical protein n=1 Tax=Streptomyces iakyrus TaxID=68219 RepID=UPI0036E2904C